MLSRRLDFELLCKNEPELTKYFDKAKGSFDFKNHHAVILLTQTLIYLDLKYKIKLSENQLCPNYFNRLDYVLFINQLIKYTPGTESRQVIGLDIGTSQSCIYPLLCTKYISKFSKIVGTDVIHDFIVQAKCNIDENQLSTKIELSLVDGKENSFSPLFEQEINFDNSVVFTMCNPPFYESAVDMAAKRENKKLFHKLQTTGHTSELITPGGDYKFVLKLLQDSEKFQDRIDWFTSLIGNLSTVKKLIPYLKQNNDRISYGIHRFKSGAYTVRWILFWSFRKDYKAPPELFNYHDKNINSKKYVKKIKVTHYSNMLLRSKILKKITTLPYISLHIRDIIIVKFPGNVFSRSYRRSKSYKNDGSVYVFELNLDKLKIIWRQGLDYKVFESFCNIINDSV